MCSFVRIGRFLALVHLFGLYICARRHNLTGGRNGAGGVEREPGTNRKATSEINDDEERDSGV